MAAIGYIYTGAGHQYVGLGKKVYDNSWGMRQFFDKVDKKYHDFKINKLSFLGPQEELSKEENGLIINSVYQAGLYEVLKERKILPEQAGGYKSGELMALTGARGIVFEDAMDFLFKKRQMILDELGRDMFTHLLVNNVPVSKTVQVAGELNRSVKSAVVSYNSENSAIMVTEKKAAAKIGEIFKSLNGAVIPLPGEEFSNFYLLEPIRKALSEELEKIEFDKPCHRILCQTTGGYYENAADIKAKFLDYIVKPARIDIMIQTMLKNAVNTFVEIGCGSLMQRLVKKADSGKRALGTHDLKSLSMTVKLAN